MAKPRYPEHSYIQLHPTIELCGRCGRSTVHYAQHVPQCLCGENEKGITYVRADLVEQWIANADILTDPDDQVGRPLSLFQVWIQQQPPVNLIQWLQEHGFPCPIKMGLSPTGSSG